MAHKRKLRADRTLETSGNHQPSSISIRSTDLVRVPTGLLRAGGSPPVLPGGDELVIFLSDGTPHIVRRHDHPPTAEQVASAELEDGSRVELVHDPHYAERSTFAVGQNGKVTFAGHIKDRGRILIPLRSHDHILGNVVLPCGVAPYNTVRDLARRIRQAIRSCVEAPNPYPSLLAAFSAYSWVADLLPTAVYLLITGLPESGKTTLLDTLRLFCDGGYPLTTSPLPPFPKLVR